MSESWGLWIRSEWLCLLSPLGSFAQFLSQMHWICTFCLKHKYLIVHFPVRLRPALGEMGEWGDAGEVSLCHPLRFLLYSLYRLSVPPFPQVPEGWCFPIIFLVLGEVLGTNIKKKKKVNTMKLIHHWAFRVIFFICSLLITPWGRFYYFCITEVETEALRG